MRQDPVIPGEDPELAAVRRHWCVLHVRPRTEKKTAGFLKLYGMWHHLPLWTKTVRRQRRKVRTELPVFPGYVFAKLNVGDRVKMMKTNLVVGTIRVLNERLLIHQLRQVARAGKTGAQIRRTEIFKAGDPVRIKYGPLAGVEGCVVRDKGGVSVVLNVEMLGQAISVALPPDDCEKLI